MSRSARHAKVRHILLLRYPASTPGRGLQPFQCNPVTADDHGARLQKCVQVQRFLTGVPVGEYEVRSRIARPHTDDINRTAGILENAHEAQLQTRTFDHSHLPCMQGERGIKLDRNQWCERSVRRAGNRRECKEQNDQTAQRFPPKDRPESVAAPFLTTTTVVAIQRPTTSPAPSNRGGMSLHTRLST